MTIQPSILIWTIICFCLLMVILNKLLFRPILKVLDDRQARIDAAREKQQRELESYRQGMLALEAKQTEKMKARALETAQQVAQAREQAEAQLAEASRKQEQALADYEETLKQERCALKSKLDAGVDSLAIASANRLAS